MSWQKISDETMDRMKKFVADANRKLADRGRRSLWDTSVTFDDALSELLTKAGF